MDKAFSLSIIFLPQRKVKILQQIYLFLKIESLFNLGILFNFEYFSLKLTVLSIKICFKS